LYLTGPITALKFSATASCVALFLHPCGRRQWLAIGCELRLVPEPVRHDLLRPESFGGFLVSECPEADSRGDGIIGGMPLKSKLRSGKIRSGFQDRKSAYSEKIRFWFDFGASPNQLFQSTLTGGFHP
jgi:hypothetical protein